MDLKLRKMKYELNGNSNFHIRSKLNKSTDKANDSGHISRDLPSLLEKIRE